jgi:hypothetical protein
LLLRFGGEQEAMFAKRSKLPKILPALCTRRELSEKQIWGCADGGRGEK